MGPASVLTIGFGAVAVCAAVFNLWLFAIRSRERVHLWLGVAAVGITGMSFGTALLYEAQTVEASQGAQLFNLAFACVLALGFLRFTAVFTGARMRLFETLSLSYLWIGALAALLDPSWMFTGRLIEGRTAWMGQTFAEAELSRTVVLLFPGFLAIFAGLIPIYWRHRARITSPMTVNSAILLWFLCGANDLAVSAHLYRGPYLMTVGWTGFVVAFTAILLRRFVASLSQVEASAGVLQQVVEERTEELRRKDLQLAHGERMATVGTLAAGVAHEVNNPLAYISANLDALEALHKDPDAGLEFEECLHETREGVARIAAVTRQLLHLARRGEGRLEPLDLHQVVASVLPIVRHEALRRARIVTHLAPVPLVMGDERLLGQVVLNLVLNALQAVPEGAPDRERVSVSTALRDGKVMLTVQDSGPGIPPEVLPHVFDPFFTTKEEGRGTGLGLAVTRQIVTRHGGDISVRSTPAGTILRVELPPADEPVRRESDADGPAGP
jgi:signal transduction histidine kinase